MPYTFRTSLHGHLVELRVGDLGAQTVLVRGSVVSKKPFAGWHNPSHYLVLPDETGTLRNVELHLTTNRLGLRYLLRVSVDGVERGLLEPLKRLATETCLNCGYSLKGLTQVNGEVQCPECGRHADAAVLGRDGM